MNKVIIKRRKEKVITLQEQHNDIFEEWVAYWRENPHRFITDYLGLTLHDFQKILIYQMNKNPNFVFVGSRGIAKSSITLLFALQRAILYPNQKILVVCPVKSQSRQFIKKIYDFIKISPNLEKEIDVAEIKTGVNESSIPFKNGSTIFSAVYGENSLGIRCHILIIDEFVRTEKEVITRVFDPMLSDSRKPMYLDLTKEQRLEAYKKEELMKLYLSSIRRAEEWSYTTLMDYIEEMTEGNKDYGVSIVPYQLGVKNGFISKKKVEGVFRENSENVDILLAEYSCIPQRGSGSQYFTYNMFERNRNNCRCLVPMSDEEFIEYKDNKKKYPFYQEKYANEIRILTMDVAVLESKNNDNTMFWLLRLIPDGGRYKVILSFGESIHGINTILQVKRAKQLFYEFDCDYFVLDTQGVGSTVFDIASTETYDEDRNCVYPAWTVVNYDDIKMSSRVLSNNCVPVVYSVKTSLQVKSSMFANMRNVLTTDGISLLVNTDDAVEYLNKNFGYYKIEDSEKRARILNSYTQTNMLIYEATNLEQFVQQGFLNLKEISGKRKDRVMSLCYGLWYVKLLQDELLVQPEDFDLSDYVFSV